MRLANDYLLRGMANAFRGEYDLLDERRVPSSACYGAHMLREMEILPIAGVSIARWTDLVVALATVKQAAARISRQLGLSRLAGAVDQLRLWFQRKAVEFADVLKMGRTQLQEVVLMTLGQEFGVYAATLGEDQARLRWGIDDSIGIATVLSPPLVAPQPPKGSSWLLPEAAAWPRWSSRLAVERKRAGRDPAPVMLTRPRAQRLARLRARRHGPI